MTHKQINPRDIEDNLEVNVIDPDDIDSNYGDTSAWENVGMMFLFGIILVLVWVVIGSN